MQCNESNNIILKRREHFKNQDNSRIFYLTKKQSKIQRNFTLAYNKINTNYIILTDVFIVLLNHLLHQLINWLATEKKTKRLNAKKLMFKK